MSYTKDPVYGNHLGIVVNKEDPEYRGRVQVWIPYMSNTLHTDWNADLKDKKFKHIHDSGALTPALVEELKKVLPWAECASPIMGGGTAAKYNSYTGITDTYSPRTFGGPVGNASPLSDPTLNGLKNRAKELVDEGNRNRGKDDSPRELNFSDEAWGGRCFTAGTAWAAAMLDYKPLAYNKTGADGGSTAASVASGENRTFQKSGFYSEPFTPVAGLYKPQIGDQMVMEGGKPNKKTGLRYGHNVTCIDDGSISGEIKWASDNTGREDGNDYLFGGRKTTGENPYYNTKVLRLNDEGLKRVQTTLNLRNDVLTQRPVDTAEIPGTSINPSKTATDITRGPESFGETGYSDISLLQRYDTLDPNVKKALYGLGAIESGFNPSEAYSNSNNSYRNYVRYPDGREAEVESLGNLPPGTKTLEVRNKYVKEEYLKNGGNLSAAQKVAGDSGFFQTSGNMNSGGVDLRTGSASEQMVKVSDYIQKNRPDAYSAMVNGDFNTAYKILGENEWPSLNPKYSTSNLNGALLASQSDVSSIDKQVKSVGSVVPDDGIASSPMVNPIPNFNPATYPASLSGAQASGFVSIPDAGAKVFVFFLGGDIQKPVYFASLLETESYRKVAQTASDTKQTEDKYRRSSVAGILHEGTGLTINNNYSLNPETQLPSIEDNLSLNNALGSSLSFSSADINITSANHYTNTTAGTTTNSAFAQIENFNLSHTTSEEKREIIGSLTKKEIEAHEKLQKIINDVQKKKVEEIKENSKKGEKVPCPLCSTSYAVDRASSAAKRVTSLLRKIKLPYFSYAVDTLEFLVKLILVPFCSIVPGSALGECGNSDCEKGMIPSPQKPIEEANKNAAKTLASKQKEISNLEQKLGNGGSYTLVATKDVVISAGLPSGDNNDAPCHVETVNKSTAIALKASDDKQTLIQKSSNCKNVVCCPSIQAPGGNIILRGGNAVKIIAGSPGIELLTKGKLTLNCGSLEILSGDGQMILGSNNHTVLKGKVVTIDANDRSGEGGVEINSPHMLCKGLSVSGDAGIKGGLRIEGELSVPFMNGVAQRMSSDDAMPPDQSGKFSTWAVGAAQTNDIANTIRLAITHYGMKDAMLLLSNIIKYVQERYNTILVNTVVETNTTGFGVGYGYVQVFNWHHNHMQPPEPHNHDYIMPKGTWSDDKSSVFKAAVEPNPVPTRARQNGMGMDGGPKSLAGCGGFGGWGGGSYKGRRAKYNKLNSFGLYDKVKGFSGTKLQDNNVTYKYNKDGSIEFNIDEKPCD
jgi:phage gp45-like